MNCKKIEFTANQTFLIVWTEPEFDGYGLLISITGKKLTNNSNKKNEGLVCKSLQPMRK